MAVCARKAKIKRMNTQRNRMSTETVTIRLSAEELTRLDEIRDGSRSAFVRELIRRAGPLDEEPNYEEALSLLARSARAGKVQAQVALERALRPNGEPVVEGGSLLDEILDDGAPRPPWAPVTRGRVETPGPSAERPPDGSAQRKL
jgi:hypothetical protein